MKKINEFKEDDIITRVLPSITGDFSYINDKMQLVGIKGGMIVLIRLENQFGEEYDIMKLSVARYTDGWDYYPDDLVSKAKKKIKDILKIKAKNKLIKKG